MDKKQEYIQRFKELYKRKEGVDLTDQEALEYFEKLVTLANAVYQPIEKKFFDNLVCIICEKPINFQNFKDEQSENEFLISGMCQKCQDETF